MKKYNLKRVIQNPHETFGVLYHNDGTPICLTLEQPWRDNKQNVSCIPVGTYVIEPHISPNFGKCLRVNAVEKRSHILFHAGNTHLDTRGCILVGLTFGVVKGYNAVTQSKTTLYKLLRIIDEPSFLEILL